MKTIKRISAVLLAVMILISQTPVAALAGPCPAGTFMWGVPLDSGKEGKDSVYAWNAKIQGLISQVDNYMNQLESVDFGNTGDYPDNWGGVDISNMGTGEGNASFSSDAISFLTENANTMFNTGGAFAGMEGVQSALFNSGLDTAGHLASGWGYLSTVTGIVDSVTQIWNLSEQNNSGLTQTAVVLLNGANIIAGVVAVLGSAGMVTVGAPVVAASLVIAALTSVVNSSVGREVLNSTEHLLMHMYNHIMNELEKYLADLLQDIGVYKPNIYIYTHDATEITVRFGYPQLLTKTIPDYTGRWNVTAHSDGTLYADGREYGYLFYESKTWPELFDYSEGFMICAKERKTAFEEILSAYGFNETEIADFTEFWCEKLDAGCDYMMYPQYTQAVDIAMPVELTPAPDVFVRFWFAFEKTDGRVTADEPQIIPFVRDSSYTAVEWGGFILP